ncbi:MAG TPA: M23 family metallopeptidase [Thermoanaerobaculia bacterium]|nr:M23 family metallopeptidase [Thermoanaerobaculia bacterium]
MIEIQIHPSDIRRKVRYFFFDRRRVVIGIVALSAILGGLIGSMAAAPTVIRRVYKNNYLSSMHQEREIQRERLRENVVQMSSLDRSLEEQRIRVEKLLTVYGLDRSLGQGGESTPDAGSAALFLGDARWREMSLKYAMQRLQEQLDLLAEYERANRDLVRHTPSILPVPSDQFVLTSPFGNRISPFTRAADFHKGLDLSAPRGTPIYAAADGVVTFSGRYPLKQSVNWWRMGNVVVINHADRFITIYAHCDTTVAKRGERVRQGQTVATVGSTGWSTNAHLHYEVRSDIEKPGTFVPIDPRIYILNYQWNNEASLLIQARASKDYKDYDPLPSAFVGRKRG